MRALTKLYYLSAVFTLVIIYHYLTFKGIKDTQQELCLNKICEIENKMKTLLRKMTDPKKSEEDVVNKNKKMKYILLWNNPKNMPFVNMDIGQQIFVVRNCQYTNCFVTSDRNYLGDVSKFDVIVFAGPELGILTELPKTRSPHQKYVFASIESAENYPICTYRFDNFFNWTWTYRLDSEIKRGIIMVRDSDGSIVGPKIDMDWMELEDMDPTIDELAAQLKKKSKAAAWFVSKCRTFSGREEFVKELQKYLAPYGLNVDIYGACGPNQCGLSNNQECFEMIKRDYYFYLSFENSFAIDYVTENLLYGLQYNAIPVVYGGANYSRFMPDKIYLNARELAPKKLAKKMKYLIDNTEEYKQYFFWTNHYSYCRRDEYKFMDEYCELCRLVNDEEMMKKTAVYKDFYGWWNMCSTATSAKNCSSDPTSQPTYCSAYKLPFT